MPVAKTATAILIAASLCICTLALAQSELEDVGKVKDYYAEWLSSIPGVTDVGVGEGPGAPPRSNFMRMLSPTRCGGCPAS